MRPCLAEKISGLCAALPYGLVALLPLLSGCSSSSSADDAPPAPPPARELTTSNKPKLSGDDIALMRTGKRLFEVGMYTLAEDAFESLRTAHPSSPYLDFAEIKLADIFLVTTRREEAAHLFSEVAKRRPSSPVGDAARIGAALAHLAQFSGVGRDTAPLERAREFLNQIPENSPYYPSAAQKLEEIAAIERDYEVEVAEFYRRRDATAAALRRETEWVPRREVTLQQHAIRTVAAQPTLEVVRQVKGSLPETVRSDGESKHAEQRTRPRFPEPIRDLVCQTSPARMAVLFLNFPLATETLPLTIDPDSFGELLLPLPLSAGAPQPTADCFGTNDVVVTERGVRFSKSSSATVVAVERPDRIIVSFPG